MHLKHHHTHIFHFDLSSPAERRVEPLDSLSLERGMKEEDRSDIVFSLSSLKEAPPSDDPVCRIGQGGVVHSSHHKSGKAAVCLFDFF